MSRILIIEDDPAIRLGVTVNLERDGHDVLAAEDAESGRVLLEAHDPALLILDLMLPGQSGFEFCRALRSEGRTLPILMLTARSEESDRVLGLDLGADDYVTKPFSVLELMARVRALLRRTAPAPAMPDLVEFGLARVNFRRFEAFLAGSPVQLPPKAMGVLRVLAANEGEVVTREELLAAVWGDDVLLTPRTVDNQVALLRSRLGDDAAEPRFLHTVHGVGYRFDGDGASARPGHTARPHTVTKP